MNLETKNEIEAELQERKDKMTMLGWAEFLKKLSEKLGKEDLQKLFNGIDRMKAESKIQGYNSGLEKAEESIQRRINVLNRSMEIGKNPDGSKISDSSYSFILKLKENLETALNYIEKEKING